MNTLLENTPFVWLAPQEALVVIMCYYVHIRSGVEFLFTFHLSLFTLGDQRLEIRKCDLQTYGHGQVLETLACLKIHNNCKTIFSWLALLVELKSQQSQHLQLAACDLQVFSIMDPLSYLEKDTSMPEPLLALYHILQFFFCISSFIRGWINLDFS